MTANNEVGLTHAQFSELVGAIYDCAVDSSRWETTLPALVAAFDGCNAVLSLSDIRYDRFLINRSVGIEPHWLRKLQDHLPEIHEQLGQALASWTSLDEPYIVSRHLTPEYRAQSPYFNEMLKPQKISDILQYFLIGTPDRFAGFALSKDEPRGLIGPRDIELGRLLLPHIRRSVVISDLLDARTIENDRLTEVLNSLRAAVFLIDDRARILQANQAAQRMLRRGDALRDANGMLQATATSASAELKLTLERASHDESEMGPVGTAIRLTSVGSAPLFASVLPLKGGFMRTRLTPTAAAAVFVGEPPDGRDIAHFMELAFELTRAETRVLTGFLDGKTLAQISSDLDIAPTTTRTHLDHIFSKTGVTRQADLVRLAMQLAPPARP
jgi:DNA-binding CsgD family transcriptional regulator/PAS domain-containing protein